MDIGISFVNVCVSQPAQNRTFLAKVNNKHHRHKYIEKEKENIQIYDLGQIFT